MRVKQRARQRGVELPLVISDHADWDELLATIDEVRPPRSGSRTAARRRWCTPPAQRGIERQGAGAGRLRGGGELNAGRMAAARRAIDLQPGLVELAPPEHGEQERAARMSSDSAAVGRPDAAREAARGPAQDPLRSRAVPGAQCGLSRQAAGGGAAQRGRSGGHGAAGVDPRRAAGQGASHRRAALPRDRLRPGRDRPSPGPRAWLRRHRPRDHDLSGMGRGAGAEGPAAAARHHRRAVRASGAGSTSSIPSPSGSISGTRSRRCGRPSTCCGPAGGCTSTPISIAAPTASHRYREVFFPWPHLLFADEVFEEFLPGTQGRPSTRPG